MKEDEEEEKDDDDEEMKVCSTKVKIWIPYFGNSLRSIKTGFGCFFKPKGRVFDMRSIRVFSKFSLDPYYEPLL